MYIQVCECRRNEWCGDILLCRRVGADPERDPLLLWLTGGPGFSGSSGLEYEIGIFIFLMYSLIYDAVPIEKQLKLYKWGRKIVI